jgi:hypothetical protein
VSESYRGAIAGELLGAPRAPRLFPLFYRLRPGPPARADATDVVLRAGVRIMRRRLTAALILAALIVVCVSGCHFVTVHTSPARHGSAARQ